MTTPSRPLVRRFHGRLCRHTLFAAALLAGLSAAHAANKTWDGGGADPNWLTGPNWDLDVPPVPADVLFFAGNVGLMNNNNFNLGTLFNGLNFSAGAGPFTLGGNGITLGGNVVNSSTTLQTINLDLAIGAVRNFTTTVGGGNLQAGGVISGIGSVNKTGAGTLFLTGTANTYIGETLFGASGIVNVASLSDYGVPSAIGARTLANENPATGTGIGLHFTGGTLQYTGSTPQSTNRNIRVFTGNGATFDASGSTPDATLSFTKTGANLNLFDTGGSRTFSFTGSNTGNNSFSIQLTNQAAAATSALKTGLGTWVLNGPDANIATGSTTVQNGQLVLAKTNATAVSGPMVVGSAANSAVVRLAGSGGNQIADNVGVTFTGTGGVLRLSGNNETLGGLSSAAGAGIVENESGVSGTSTLTVNLGAAQSFGGVLRDGDGVGADGVLAFTKLGAGALTLGGASTYTGPTSVNGGTLTVTGSLGAASTVMITNATVNGAGTIAGNVNVNSGGTLAQTGTVGGAVNIGNGGVVNSPGTFSGAVNIANGGLFAGTSTVSGLVTADSGARISPSSETTPGTLTVGSLTLNSDAVVNAEFGATSDLINVTTPGGLTVNGGSFNVFATGGVAPLTANGAYPLLDYNTGFSGSLGNLSIGNSQFGKTYALTNDAVNTQVALTIADAAVTEWRSPGAIGQWSDANNWTAGVPDSVGAAALFGPSTESEERVQLDGPKTVGSIRFDNTSGVGYFLTDSAAQGSLILDNGGASAVIEVISGSHVINVPMTLAGNLNVVPATGTSIRLDDPITGAKSLTVSGPGRVILAGANSYATTAVNAGTLQVGDGDMGRLGVGDATVASGATLAFFYNGNGTIPVANNLLGAGTVVKDGLGNVNFSGANTIAALNVNLGGVQVGAAGTFANAVVTMNAGTSFDLNETNTTIGGLSGPGGIVTDNGATATTTTLTVNQAGNTTFSGTIEEGAGQTVALTKTGAGTLTLAGTGANTYAGMTTVLDGSLTLAKTGVNAIAGNVQIGDGVGSDFLNLGASDQIADAAVLTLTAGGSGNSAFFHLNGFNETVQGIATTVGNAAVIANNSATIASTLTLDTQGINYTYDGIIRNGGAAPLGLTKNGSGTLTLANTANVVATSYTGTTTLNAGRLVLENLTGFASPIVNNVTAVDSLVFNQTSRDGTVSGIISGPGGVTLNGPNTLTLTGVNTFGGNFTLNSGTFGIGANGAQGTGAIFINGGNIRAAGAARALSNPVFVFGSFILGRLTDLNGPITLNGNPTITASNPDGVANGNSVLGPIGGDSSVTFAEGAGGNVAPFGLGTGALVVNAVNTHEGSTTIASGRVNVTATGALADNALNVNGGILNLNNLAQAVSSLQGTGGTINLAAGHTLTVTQGGSETQFSGVLAGPGALVKNGELELRLTGNSPAFTGPTTVNAGTLFVSGTISGSAVTLNTGTLLGTGTTGAVTSNAGTIVPGGVAALGTLTTGAMTLDGASTWKFELSTAGVVGSGVNDLLAVNGPLTLDGTLQVSPYPSFGEGTYRLANYTGALTDNGLSLESTFLSAFPGSAVDTATPGQVNLVVVPEPGSVLLLMSGLGVFAGLRRRRFVLR